MNDWGVALLSNNLKIRLKNDIFLEMVKLFLTKAMLPTRFLHSNLTKMSTPSSPQTNVLVFYL